MAILNTLRSKGWMGIGTTGSLLSNCATYLKTASPHLHFLTRLHFTILKITFFCRFEETDTYSGTCKPGKGETLMIKKS